MSFEVTRSNHPLFGTSLAPTTLLGARGRGEGRGERREEESNSREVEGPELLWRDFGSIFDAFPGDLIKTGAPNIVCSALPDHWRSNKTLPNSFR